MPNLGNLNGDDAAKLIRSSSASLLREWKKRCKVEVPTARNESKYSLENSMPKFLERLAKTLELSLTADRPEVNSAIERELGEERADLSDYTLDQVIYEYQVLREVLVQHLEAEHPLRVSVRAILHAFIDIGVRKSAVRFADAGREALREVELKLASEKAKLDLIYKDQSVLVADLQAEREIRGRFVGALTHDLRTPMTAARMNAQLLQRKAAPSPMIDTLTGRIVRSMDRADRMIHDLLDANSIKAGAGIPILVEECRLDEVLDSGLQELVEAHGPRFNLRNDAEKVSGFWDSSGLRRILDNLSGNAIKYGRPQGPITIALSRIDGDVELAVHNEGNPISAEDQKSLFDFYRRTESAQSSGQKGWGIGLTLVKGIAEAHGGSTRVESDSARGTTFYVRLPLDARPTH